MKSNKKNAATTTLTIGFLAGGVMLTALATSGCDTLPAEQIAAMSSGSVKQSAATPILAQELDPRNKLAANHNETFLVHRTGHDA